MSDPVVLELARLAVQDARSQLPSVRIARAFLAERERAEKAMELLRQWAEPYPLSSQDIALMHTHTIRMLRKWREDREPEVSRKALKDE